MSTGIDEREQWRARIMRALQELRSEESSDRRIRRDDQSDDGSPDSVKL